ncbi:porin [Rheinheimera sp.]|uniref:porin n=1 Tax=Rheinheimera sp. TaxID=1869214 RepID=UPI00307F7C02
MKSTLFRMKLTAVGFALTASGQVAAFDWDIYGKIDLQGLYTENDLYRYADEGWQIEAPLSRIGAKAKQAFNDEFNLVAVFEYQVNGLDQANRDDKFGLRNAYIGFAGKSWGELVFGKNDTRFKKSEGKIDLFNETLNDMAQLTPGQDRLENVVVYTSPVLSGLQFSATYQTGVSDEESGGYDWTLSYGDSGFKSYSYYVAYSQAHDLNNLDAQRVLVHARLAEVAGGLLSGGLMFQHSEHQTRPLKGDALLAELAFDREQFTYKLQWQKDDSKTRHPEEGRLWSAGLEYGYSKELAVYTMFSMLDLQSQDDNSAALGVRYTF